MMKGFVKISKYSGMREDLVQAGGGNSSFKISDDKMAIKASGYQLADITDKEGYALVNPQIIRDSFLNCEDLNLISNEDSQAILANSFIEGCRPSIETFLHAISGKYTLHTHPTVVNVLTCRKQGMEVLAELFPDALLVPYATPGVELAKTYFEAYRKTAKEEGQIFDVVFLQNHGLVVSAESADEVISMTETVTKRIEEYLGINLFQYHELTDLWTYFSDKIIWKVTDKNVIEVFERRNEWEHVFCPDCIVFLGKKFLKLSRSFSKKDIDDFICNYGMPIVVNYGGQLYIIADSVKKALEIQSVMSFSAQVMDLNAGYECNFLTDDEQNFLLNWDAEKYRRQMK